MKNGFLSNNDIGSLENILSLPITPKGKVTRHSQEMSYVIHNGEKQIRKRKRKNSKRTREKRKNKEDTRT